MIYLLQQRQRRHTGEPAAWMLTSGTTKQETCLTGLWFCPASQRCCSQRCQHSALMRNELQPCLWLAWAFGKHCSCSNAGHAACSWRRLQLPLETCTPLSRMEKIPIGLLTKRLSHVYTGKSDLVQVIYYFQEVQCFDQMEPWEDKTLCFLHNLGH